MKNIFIKIFIILNFIFSLKAYSFEENQTIKNIFVEKNINGTLVLYDVKNKKTFGYNEERAVKRFYPASTFKIFNSLIGLSEKVVKDADEVFYKYNGEKVYLNSWAVDSNLRYAIKVSQVPAYKELAKKIGIKRMQENINKLNYGNKEIGNEIDGFWLHGPLKISAVEQINLLTQLVQNKLPYDAKHQEEVKDITVLQKNSNYVLHGKTGWATNNIEIPVGWFIGWLEKKDNVYIFALNMDNPDSKLLPERENIVIEAFKNLKIIQ